VHPAGRHAGRYGGDEFTILLVDTSLESGIQIAERIRAAVARAHFETRGSASLQVTVSVRRGGVPMHGREPEVLIDMPTRPCTARSRSAATACAPPRSCSSSPRAPSRFDTHTLRC